MIRSRVVWLTLKLARECILANNLGSGQDPDMLCVSLSSTDYAGHQYGPNAEELEDMFVRLDQELARFLRFLDDRVGEGEYTVFLTADHGAAHAVGYMKEHNLPGDYVPTAPLVDSLNRQLNQKFQW